jgi:hypothetical protein
MDAQLQRLTELWPQLSEAKRCELLQVVLDNLPENERRDSLLDLSRAAFSAWRPLPPTEQAEAE